MTELFTPYRIKGLSLKNRIVMPPMCTYSVESQDGIPTDWHYVHYTSRAIGGTGLIIVEMTGIVPEGRITSKDTGIWNEAQVAAFRKITDAAHAQGAKIGIQLGHAGRKALDAEPPAAPSAIPFDSRSKVPEALSADGVAGTIAAYGEAARRAVEAGFDTVEIHGAHGYLIHQFHSPLTNRRDDAYGQDLPLFGEEVVRAVKAAVPANMPVIMRVSAREYVDGGYDEAYALEFCRRYRDAGVDMFHVSSGGEGPIGSAGLPHSGPGYQAGLAEHIGRGLNVPVIAVGKLEGYEAASAVLGNGQAELVAVGRGMLSDPYWALHAEEALTGNPSVPKPYERGLWRRR